MPKKILLAEDDPATRNAISKFLEARGHVLDVVDSREAVMRVFRRQRYGMAILDYQLADGDALPLVQQIHAVDARVPVVMLTGYGTIDLAVRALKLGAKEFLTKPVDLAKLADLVDHFTNRKAHSGTFSRFFSGDGPAMQRLMEELDAVRDTDAPVLLLGETGTGKSHLARHLHDVSRRGANPFVEINCAGLSRDLLDSDLFGHERGAFTGAHAAKQGLMDAADKGTLFLDEIGDIDPSVQPKILKVVEEQRFRRMGDVKERRVDVRLIAATNVDLGRAVRDGSFRGDLYYRISAFCLHVPPLRERLHELETLVGVLLEDLDPTPIDYERALPKLRDHSWPGNFRELKNVLLRALAFRSGNVITDREIHIEAGPGLTESDSEARMRMPQTLVELEKAAILAALDEADGRVEAAARRLGLPRSTLYHKLRAYGLASPPQRRTK